MSKTSRKFKKMADEGKTIKDLKEHLKKNKPKTKIDLWKYLGIKHIDDLNKDEFGIRRL